MPTYREEFRRSIEAPEAFWAEQARRIHWETPFEQVLDRSKPPFARWFVGGTTNLCYNAVDRHLATRAQQDALIYVSTETGIERRYTYAELHAEVNRMAAVMRSLNVKKGDRVLIYLPMIAEALFAMLACARLGAIHSVVFGGFAAPNLAARIDDAKPALIVTADAGARAGKVIDYTPLVDEALSRAEYKVPQVLLIDRQLAPERLQANYLVAYEPLREQFFDAHVPCEWLESNEPSYVLYTSGTTGQAEGRAARCRRLCGGARGVDGAHLPGRARRHDVHRVGYRLGGRAQLHHLCAADRGADHRHVRRHAGAAGRRHLVAARRAVQDQPDVHRADRDPRAEEAGPATDGASRSVEPARAVSRRRTARRTHRAMDPERAEKARHRQLLADRNRLADDRDSARHRGIAAEARLARRAVDGLQPHAAQRSRRARSARRARRA